MVAYKIPNGFRNLKRETESDTYSGGTCPELRAREKRIKFIHRVEFFRPVFFSVFNKWLI